MSDVFKRMQEQAQEGRLVRRQDAFQERIVKQLLRYANLQLNMKQTHREAKEKYGSPDLNFRWFYEEFGFPVHLLSQKIPFTHKITLADIYGQSNFKKLSFWKEYEEQVSTNGIDLSTDRAAMIFNLPHAREAFLMVIHNQPTQAGVLLYDAENRVDEPWPRTTFPLGKTGIVAVLESFKSFMQTVGTQWAE